MPRADLHLHSAASDGELSPAALADACEKAGLSFACLTDHDTAEGVPEFLAAAKGRFFASGGVEFSVDYEGELHLLAYRVNFASPGLQSLLAELRAGRALRAQKIVGKLCALGLPVSYDEVARLAGGGAVGRPHIADALVRQGFAKNTSDAFARYLGRGAPAYFPRERISSKTAIDAAHAAGGLAVFAHPKLTRDADLWALTKRLCREGLDGVEAFYPLHSDAEAREFCEMAKRFGLFVTQGSDFHGPRRTDARLGEERRGEGEIGPALREIFGKNA